jgi:hypothetical protein
MITRMTTVVGTFVTVTDQDKSNAAKSAKKNPQRSQKDPSRTSRDLCVLRALFYAICIPPLTSSVWPVM